MKLLSYSPVSGLYCMAVLVDRMGCARLSLLGGEAFMPRQREGHLTISKAINGEGNK